MSGRRFLLLGFGLTLAGWGAGDVLAQSGGRDSGRQSVLLRLAGDSSVVGHSKLSTVERGRLVLDIPNDDPRVALLQSATAPRQRMMELAATFVSVPREPEAERLYLVYWLGYRVTGDEVRGLSALQWDSIFQEVGRQAALRVSARGQPQAVEVAAAAVRPVGQSFDEALAALALALPADSVTIGASWQDEVVLAVDAPDGSRQQITIAVVYRLARIDDEAGRLIARIEFDGDAVAGAAGAAEVAGRYYGESVFAVEEGRYDRVMALAKLEVRWSDSSGLPPNHSVYEWQTELNRN
jgi:hypothetical protein